MEVSSVPPTSPTNNNAAETDLTKTILCCPINENPENLPESDDKVTKEVDAVENANGKNEDDAIDEDEKMENASEKGKKVSDVPGEERNGDVKSGEENDEENPMDEDSDGEDAAAEETAEGQPKEHNDSEKGDEGKKGKKTRRSRKKKGNVANKKSGKDEDKPESSGKKTTVKKALKKAESMGMIFMCSSKTKKDCYRHKVLGLPASKRDVVEKIYKGMRLFLFDVDLRLMYGIYKAAGPGGYNIDPKAFKSQFPSQVRFTILEDCLPLAEEKFKRVIKGNYFSRNKFDCLLNAEQVKNLCKLFIASSKGPKSADKPRRSRRDEARPFVDRDRTRPLRLDNERRSTRGRPHSYRDRERERDRPVIYEREILSPLPLARPPPGPAPYAYDRAVIVDPYRRDPPHEAYRRDPPHEAYRRDLPHEAYRRDPPLERHDVRVLDSEPRYRDEIVTRDPYVPIREPYPDTVYYSAQPPEYYPPSGLKPEYHQSLRPVTDYGPSSSSAQVPQYYQLRTGYRY